MEKIMQLKELMGTETLLNELILALSEDELNENAEWIARMWDIELY